MGQNWDGGKFNDRIKDQISQRHAALHDKLKLNALQETAWQNYIAATMTNLSPSRWNQTEMAKLAAPEHMEKMVERMKERESRMTAQLNALKTLCVTL